MTLWQVVLHLELGRRGYSIAPALSSGLIFNTSTGAISGTPTAASAATTYTVTVTDTNAATAAASFSLTVNSAVTAAQSIASAALTQDHAALSFTPVSGAGGTGTLSYSISPALPTGLSLNTSTGAISGTPTVNSASSNFTVAVTDQNGATASNTFSLTVNSAVTATQVKPSVSLTYDTASSVVPVTGSGGTGTLAYSISPVLTAGLSFSTSTGAISGTPTAVVAATRYTATVTDANGASASNSFLLSVGKATATVTLGNLTQTYNGSTLSATATTNLANLSVSFTYNGSATAPTVAGTYTVVATINETNYQGSATGSMTINQAASTISWANPAAITYGTALSAAQLNATATVPGTFTCTPAAGTVLSAGTQTLKVTFSPTDSTDYQSATKNVMLTVNQANQSITFGSIAAQVVGNTVNLGATSTSGLAVSFASTTPSVSSVSGTMATMLSAGTCTIQASQAGNANDAAASPVSESFAGTSAAGFTLIAEPNSETIHRGILAAFLLEAQSVNGFSGNVKITCSGGPSDSVCGDFPQTLKLRPYKLALAISGILFPANTKPGTYTLTFTGTSVSTTVGEWRRASTTGDGSDR